MSKIQPRGLTDAERQKVRDDAYKTPKMLAVRAERVRYWLAGMLQRTERYSKQELCELIKDQAEYIKKLEAGNEEGR